MTDPIADMLTRIRNAILVNKNTVVVPYSKLKHNIATILKQAGFIKDVHVDTESKFKNIIVTINDENQNARITKLERVSKPGRRHYVKSTEVPQAMDGRGIFIVSTSKGLMTDAQARKEHVGGELMVKVY